jgi:glycosyltransferase involved in cell wall biosynthesis
MTKCTVAIPVYNRQNLTLNHVALESALAQDMPDLEILVVDDCSTDGTYETLQSYHDPRLRLVRNERNVGLFGNFNRCLHLAQGQYLRILCSDDKLIPGCLGREVDIMDVHPNVVLLSTRGRRVDESGRILGPQAHHFRSGIYSGQQAIHAALWFQAHYAYNPFNYPSGILLRREVAIQVGLFDTTMRMAGDVDFFLRMLERGDLAVLDALGCEITMHPQQEGMRLAGDPAPMREIYMLTERYRPLLEQVGTYKRIRQQLAAYALGLAFKYWRMGMPQAKQAHHMIAWSSGVSQTAVIVAVMRLLSLRMLMKTTGIRFVPLQPLQAL